VGNKESETCWTEFFESMIGRGLRAPTSVTSDGAPGLKNAIEGCFSHSLRIRCWFHKLGNIRNKLPEEIAEEFLAGCRAVRDATSERHARDFVGEIADTYGREFPAAVACLLDDLDASLAHLRLPVRHRRFVRTTNLIERSFEEERRRSKIIPRFTDERSAMKLVFAVLIRSSERGQHVAINDIERGQLKALRRELGIDPPPTIGEKREGGSREHVA
jgi:transposase-like protein